MVRKALWCDSPAARDEDRLTQPSAAEPAGERRRGLSPTVRRVDGDQRAARAGRIGPDGVYAGRLFGVPVYFAPSWFLVAGLLTAFLGPEFAQRTSGGGRAAGYVLAFVFALLIYLSVLVHELSHSLVAKALGLPVRRITLQLLGGVSEIEREPETPSREYLVAMAGPLVSLLLAGLGFAFVGLLHGNTVTEVLALQVALANGAVAVFNLLPGLPLDGGRILRAAVWGASGRPEFGSLVAGWVGRGLSVAILVLPIVLIFRGTGPAGVLSDPARLFNLVYLALLAYFIWAGASSALLTARLQRRLPAVQVARLTRRAAAVAGTMPLAEALRRAAEVQAGAIVVVDADGRPEAIVSEAAVSAVPVDRRPWVAVATVARRLQPSLILAADATPEQVLETMRGGRATEYLVRDGEGRICGVLVADDVAGALGLPVRLRAGRASAA